jgi:hypothetical protein
LIDEALVEIGEKCSIGDQTVCRTPDLRAATSAGSSSSSIFELDVMLMSVKGKRKRPFLSNSRYVPVAINVGAVSILSFISLYLV